MLLFFVVPDCGNDKKAAENGGYVAVVIDRTFSRSYRDLNDSTHFNVLHTLLDKAQGSDYLLDAFDVTRPHPEPFRSRLEGCGPKPSPWNAEFKKLRQEREIVLLQNQRALETYIRFANDLYVQPKPKQDWTYLNRHLHRIWPKLMDTTYSPRWLYINSDLLNDEPGLPQSPLPAGLIDSLNQAIEQGAHILIYTETNYRQPPYDELNATYLSFPQDLHLELLNIHSITY